MDPNQIMVWNQDMRMPLHCHHENEADRLITLKNINDLIVQI